MYDEFLLFDLNYRLYQQSIYVNIIDDPFFELDVENFTVTLVRDLFFPLSFQSAIISPNHTTISIIDNEGSY